MPRAGTRSQKPSQSQPRAPRPSQSQRARRPNRDDDENDEEEEDGDEEAGENNEDELERKAHDLVRLALFVEQRRVPLRRDEISKKGVLLGTGTRQFNAVFARAQEILHKTFGMELVELLSRAERDKDANDKDAELLKNTGVKKRAAPSGTKTYILRSMLHPAIIEQAAATDPALLAAEKADLGASAPDDDDDDTGVGTRPHGSILAWRTADQLGAIGVLYVLLALILVDGRVMSDTTLRTLLRRLRLPPAASVPLSSQATHHPLGVDAYLAQLVRQGYLERARVGEQKAGGAKRARAPAATQGGGGDANANAWEWRWGARAMGEVGERAVARFMAEFMVDRQGGAEEEGEDDDDDGDGDGDGGAQDAREDAERKKRMEAVMKGIERAAAGAPLSDIR
ncbi:MAGE-domain-containing protein [Amylocystis lapponica]|nr:MAGE-domain-containing protein [Amylocystis lapponica]